MTRHVESPLRWILWCFVLCALVSARVGRAEDSIHCHFDAISGSEKSRSNWHDFFHSADVHHQQDKRAGELELEVQEGADCLLKQAQQMTQVATAYRKAADESRSALKDQLQAITASVQTLSTQLAALQRDTHRGSSTQVDVKALAGIAAQLVQYNQRLAAIEHDLQNPAPPPEGAAPPINVTTVSYASAVLPTSKADSAPRAQLDPRTTVLDHFPYSQTHVEFALAAIPDPRVPRHRRQYDNTITALNQGMLRAGFVLDSYSFPWSEDLQANAMPSVGKNKPDGDHPYVLEDDRYGLMLFRRDVWRVSGQQTKDAKVRTREVEVRALYLIPESGTYGLQHAAFRSALLRIDHQVTPGLPGAVKDESDEQAAGHCGNGSATPNLVATLFGPTFSGSLDSIRETMLELSSKNPLLPKLCRIRSLRLLAATTTVNSNDQVNQTGPTAQYQLIHYVPLARTDREKLDYLRHLGETLGVPARKVAIVYESTTFGMEACKVADAFTDPHPSLCNEALKLPIPVNIADVRFGLHAKLAANAREANSKIRLPLDTTHLSLEDGAENGSEFPESQQSPLTSASTALELQRLIDALRDRGSQLIIIIATDVRDRLFLIEQIGAQLSGPLFVDLGADRLLGHPDFIHATRGTLTLSSSWLTDRDLKITGCEKEGSCPVNQVWSTDEQATQAAAIRYWGKVAPSTAAGAAPPQPIPYIVSRSGLVSKQDLFVDPVLGNLEILCSSVLGIIFAILGVVFVYQYQGQALCTWTASWTQSALGRFLLGLVGAGLVWLITKSLTLAAICGVLGLYQLGFQSLGLLQWSSAVVSVSGLFLLITAVLQAVGTFIRVFRWWSGDLMHPLLLALSQAPGGGMAYPLAQCVAVLAIIVSMLIGQRILALTARNDTAVALTLTMGERAALQRPTRNAALFVALLALATICVVSVIFVYMRQVTIFGWWADLAAFAGLTGTTLLAFCFLIGAVVAVIRIEGLCDLVTTHLREIHGWDAAADSTKQSLMWTGLSGNRPNFVATPVLAHGGSGGRRILSIRRYPGFWRQSLDDALHEAPLTARGLRALYALLASEMGVYQRCIVGVAVLTVSSSLIVYLFPVSQATPLMVLNLVVLLLAGAYAAYQTVSFEGNTILSNVLCNRPQTREWSLSLFAGVAIPFVALAIVIGIGQVPGVLDVGSGVLSALLKWLKIGGE